MRAIAESFYKGVKNLPLGAKGIQQSRTSRKCLRFKTLQNAPLEYRRGGDSNPRYGVTRTLVFETSSFSRSDTSPLTLRGFIGCLVTRSDAGAGRRNAHQGRSGTLPGHPPVRSPVGRILAGGAEWGQPGTSGPVGRHGSAGGELLIQSFVLEQALFLCSGPMPVFSERFARNGDTP